MIFRDINELIEYLEKDKSSKGIYNIRFPARFILLSNYKQLHYFLDKISHEIIMKNIADLLLENKDGWITISHGFNFLKELDLSKDYILLGISELLRFYNDEEFFVFLNSIMEIEGSPHKNGRIYVPLVGLKNRIENVFFNRYPRRFEWDPRWIVNDDLLKTKIYFVDFEVEDAFIKNTKDFLNLWKISKIPDEIVSCSKTLYWRSSYFVPDESFSLDRLNNIKEYIKKYLRIDIPIDYEDKERKLWEGLLNFIIKNKKGFKDSAESILNIKNFDLRYTLELWNKGNEFSRWILKWYVLNNKNLRETYTYKVLRDVKNYGDYDLLREYWLKIFDIPQEDLNKDLLKERRDSLRYFHENNLREIPKFIEEKLIEELKDLSQDELCKYLVGISFWEKEWIVQNYDKIRDISELYPELYHYLEDLDFENLDENKKWVIEYFNEYRYSKLKNQASEKLLCFLDTRNKNKDSFYNWYYSFEKIKNIYYKETAEKKVFVDGLSLEFLNLFLFFLRKKGYETQVYVGVSELPSITELNKLPSEEYVNEFDRFIHDQPSYKYPKTFVEELEKIKEIASYISNLGDELLIFSDHGFTVFAISQLEGTKKYDFKGADHEGRCMEITEDINFIEDEDFFIHTVEDKENNIKKYLVTLKYISLGDLPRREVHGGATPEEILVPVIYASKVVSKKGKYEINILDSEISIRNPILRVRIKPEVKGEVIIKYLNKMQYMEYDEKDKVYTLILEDVNIGKLRAKIRVKNYEQDFIINIVGGIKERELL